ncbi:hypothetical protein F0562_032386 [Nyssa sinensis]|uniref:Uncharacterized protein n=1 Tax=Nyssa sinensis TaxID=561372 RepID=A0A5J5AQ32_9ASTE|nr:hypothetical protein F0562_032386 [Nyssa sinensis]
MELAHSLTNRSFPCAAGGFKRSIQSRELRCAYKSGHGRLHLSAKMATTVEIRRSGNYPPCIWDYDFLQSLQNNHKEQFYETRADELKRYVKKYLINNEDIGQLAWLEIIDDLQRLGLDYHFEKEIRNALCMIISNPTNDVIMEGGLHATALRFQILRQHGYKVSQDVFNRFKDTDGNFLRCICEDIKGMLSLYEASYLGTQSEGVLDEAKDFTTRHLKDVINKGIITDKVLVRQVSHALELPLHWRMRRFEARWYIDIYEEKEDMVPVLLELAKIDFNFVQAIYQKDLAELIRWWKHLGLKDKLEFARDRLVEGLQWGLGMAYEPEFSNCRIAVAKVMVIITVIDDIYDFYGFLEEVKLFTSATERWDICALDEFPSYLKICFVALFNTVNEMAYLNIKEHGFDSLPYFKKERADLCNVYLGEAEIVYEGRTQTLEEYLIKAWKSIACCVVLVHAYLSLNENSTQDTLNYITKDSNLLRWSSLIVRLTDDLGTSKAELERGDILKSMECYMSETGASEEVARSYIWNLIDITWKTINEDHIEDSRLPQSFVKLAINLGRAAHFMYHQGDGHGAPTENHKKRAMSFWFSPFHVMSCKGILRW